MDAFGTIKHDYETPLIDNRKKNGMKRYDSDEHKKYMRDYNRTYINGKFSINPMWRQAYGGL